MFRDLLASDTAATVLLLTVLSIPRMATKSTASLAELVKPAVSAVYFGALSEFVEARILPLGFLLFYILVCRKANP